ncbi:uncharacterized protein AKAW2_10066S [Aspergillus luchuensis]|uniref:Uncharacterized protein n=1 Tax=Aspergillus kawachii TaxID=1069201 RepID=A0A7R7ZSE3_ASPKA|nr:uncharacterized protein AKAW2_10066S [Aspergillus luchuensis]BCR93020.1 hypothetical protein AKAW2_10066S [Aspergillus luchuensis]
MQFCIRSPSQPCPLGLVPSSWKRPCLTEPTVLMQNGSRTLPPVQGMFIHKIKLRHFGTQTQLVHLIDTLRILHHNDRWTNRESGPHIYWEGNSGQARPRVKKKLAPDEYRLVFRNPHGVDAEGD